MLRPEIILDKNQSFLHSKCVWVKDYDVGFLRLVFFIVFALVYCYGLAIIVHGLREYFG